MSKATKAKKPAPPPAPRVMWAGEEPYSLENLWGTRVANHYDHPVLVLPLAALKQARHARKFFALGREEQVHLLAKIVDHSHTDRGIARTILSAILGDDK